MRARLLVAAFLAALALGGCGGDDGGGGDGGGGSAGGGAGAEHAAIREALDGYAEAVVANDEDAACAHLSARAREQAAATIPGAESCEEAHRTTLSAIGADNRDKLAEQIADVNLEIEVSGPTATIATGRSGSRPLRMRREGGRWKIDQNTLFANRAEE